MSAPLHTPAPLINNLSLTQHNLCVSKAFKVPHPVEASSAEVDPCAATSGLFRTYYYLQ